MLFVKGGSYFMYVVERLMFIVDFIDWLGRFEGSSGFLFPLPFFFWLPLYTSCVLWCALFGV